MANIHLVALAYTGDLKTYGYNSVLEMITSDLKVLETSGISLNLNGQNEQIYAAMINFNGDNLARHSMFGFLESFRANRFCENCMITKEELQTVFRVSQLCPRTKQEFDQHVKEVLRTFGKSSIYGIKNTCALNKLNFWHVTENQVGDLMHDFLEGVGQYELKLIIHGLVTVSHATTLENLNFRMRTFLYGETDRKNKPSLIAKLDTSDHGLKQNAFQFFCLFRLLPLIIGDLVPENDPFWLFYLELRKCGDILFSQKWTAGLAVQFEEMWEEHQINFKKLFPEFSLIPKHHFLSHYGIFALATGPPYKNMVAKQEMRHNFFKRSAHIMCNFKNVPYTLGIIPKLRGCMFLI